METALAVRQNVITTLDDVERAAKAMQASGFFKDVTSQAQAVVKILAGQEIGFGPFASLNGVHIIQGRPSFSANLMAAAVKRSGRYDYRVIEMSDAACELAFFEAKQEIGRSRFTKEDAAKAGTQNMQKFPRNMLFARAISNGVKWYCPDVFNGSNVYTPEELGAEVNEDGDVITITATPDPTNGNGKLAAPITQAAQAMGAVVTDIQPEEPPAEANSDSRAYDPTKFVYGKGNFATLGKYKWPSSWFPTIKAMYPKAVPQEVENILTALQIDPGYNGDTVTGAVCAWLAAKAAGLPEQGREAAALDYMQAVIDGRSEQG